MLFLQSISPGRVNAEVNKSVGKNPNQKPMLSMKPERVASMVIVALTTPPDIVVSIIF